MKQFIKAGNQYINVNHVVSITSEGGNYILQWRDHNGKAQETSIRQADQAKDLSPLLGISVYR